MWREPWRCEDVVVIPAELRRTLGSLTKTAKVGFFQLWLYSFPDCLLYSHEPAVPSELRRTLGFLTKKPCVLLEDRMNPQPFVSLGVASNFCLKQTSTQRQNKSLDPINYSIYQIVNNGFQASISVMLYYTLLALSPWGKLLLRSLCVCKFPCLVFNLIIMNSPLF